jgi:two-component sensor histidine kinase
VGPVRGALWAAVAVAVPTALRLAIHTSLPGSGFIAYYPAIALAALFLGWRWGLAVAVVSTGVANWLFGARPIWETLLSPDALVLALFALSCAVLILTGGMCRRLVQQLEAAKDRESVLNQELMHRMKNMLATVNAMAVLTARHTEPGQFANAFTGRMRALDRVTDLLGVGRDVHCEIRKLVDGALEPFRSDGNFEVHGPPCELPRDACVPLSLALHELCTNAAKHGSLSSPEGKVEVSWQCDDKGLLRISWREHDGPKVSQPGKAGMGTGLLRRQRGLKSVEVRFEPDGVCCDIEIDGAAPTAAPAEKAA